MITNIHIYKAAHSDILNLKGLKTGGEVDYFERCFEEQDEGKRDIYIAKLEQSPIGFTIYNRTPQYSLYKKLNIPEIQDLNVSTQDRRKGVGTALIKYCELCAQKEGKTQLGISVGLYSSYGAAQRLYVKLGYIPDGYGVTYDRVGVTAGELRPVDDNLCLMMIKDLA